VAVAVFAIDPVGLGGVVLRAQPGPARDRWLSVMRAMIDGPCRKIPLGIAEDRLSGGLDLAATLAAGAPRRMRGALAETDGGVLVLAMAERMAPGTAARIGQALDTGRVGDDLARFGVVVLDEGIGDERAAAGLLDRAAIHLELEALDAVDAEDLSAARWLLPEVEADDEAVAALCSASLALGVDSGRAPLLALRVARAAAALDGRLRVEAEDVSLAARLVLAPRATRMPAEPPPDQPAPPEAEQDGDDAPEAASDADTTQPGAGDKPLADQVLDAARAAIPAGLLAMLQPPARRATAPGKSGAAVRGARGRPLNTRPGVPRDGLRLNLIETLRAAAPWQRVREGTGIQIRREDLRVTRRQQRAETTTIFVVDASGSLALNRLAEAKGAVELLLADCYVRRDQVAVLAFRGTAASLLLPPTRSLVRAKRGLAGLPGGGGTPLSAGIEAGALLADAVRRRGGTPTVVLLTDGQANVGRDGKGGRPQAHADAMDAARRFRVAGHAALMIDTSPRPNPLARTLAEAMAARYLALPQADAAAVSRSVRALA
jgi:magnesium chelatase subunit D